MKATKTDIKVIVEKLYKVKVEKFKCFKNEK